YRGSAVDDVRVGRNETARHVLARREKGEEDVVLLPVAVRNVRKFRVPFADRFSPVTANEHHVAPREPGRGERLEDPVEDGAAEHVDERFRALVGEVLEPTTATGADDDGTHPLLIPRPEALWQDGAVTADAKTGTLPVLTASQVKERLEAARSNLRESD